MVRFLIAVFSAGWLLPMWMSARSLFTWLGEDAPLLFRNEVPRNSFPFKEFSLQAFTVGCIWLAAVILFWSWRLTRPVD